MPKKEFLLNHQI